MAVEVVLELHQHICIHGLLDLDVWDEIFALAWAFDLSLEPHVAVADVVPEAEEANGMKALVEVSKLLDRVDAGWILASGADADDLLITIGAPFVSENLVAVRFIQQ